MKINKKAKVVVLITLILAISVGWNLYRSYYILQKNYFQLYDTKIKGEIKLIVISDLHDHVFGNNNEQLIENIYVENPSAILIIGDMINQDSDNLHKVLSLIKKLKIIAPVYYALGNHEMKWEEQKGNDMQAQLISAGVVVLDKSFCDIELNNQKIRFGGLYDYAFQFGDLNDPLNEKRDTYDYLMEFQDTEIFKIMLSHRPDSFIFSDASEEWNIDLVISGHLHGGQVVIPFLGGLYAGDQGFFPKYIHGMYKKDNMNILITSGLSSNKKILPRWNNPPEIIVLDLMPYIQ